MYKVPTEKLLEEPNLEKIIRKYNARILEMSRDYTILEKTGHPEETEALFEDLKSHDIRQFVRSGRVAVTKDTNEHVTMFIEERKRAKEMMG